MEVGAFKHSRYLTCWLLCALFAVLTGCSAAQSEWIKFRAQLGETAAQCELGYRYIGTDGGERDYGEALRWFQIAADRGDVCGISGQGNIYFYGLGVRQDIRRGVALWRQAAAAKNPSALGHLGWLYMNGDVLPQDMPRGLSLLQQALAGGFWRANNDLGIFYMDRGAPGDFEVAQRYFLDGYEHGDGMAGVNMGHLYYRAGRYHEAFQWFSRTSMWDQSKSKLGSMYLHGDGVDRDYVQARYWLEQAVVYGDDYDEYALGYLYENGLGGSRDMPAALKLFRAAAGQNNRQALNELGQHALGGFLTPQKVATAMPYLQRASSLGNSQAQETLASLLESGMGVRHDLVHAYVWNAVAVTSSRMSEGERRSLRERLDRLGHELSPQELAGAKRTAEMLSTRLGSKEF